MNHSMTRFLKEHVHLSHVVFVLLMAAGLTDVDTVTGVLNDLSQAFVERFGMGVLYLCGLILLVCIVLMISPAGKLKLGDADEQPRYSTLSWLSMLFAAGMGTGLVFSGAAEPLLHYTAPPEPMGSEDNNRMAAQQAMMLTYLHWGLRAWAVYSLVALVVAYFAFRHDRPMLMSSPLKRLHRFHLPGWLIQVIDVFSVMAVVFGLVGSLGHGIVFMHNGLARMLPIGDYPLTSSLVILGVLFVTYMASASTKISQGIQLLSNINMLLCILLLCYVAAYGPLHYSLDMAFEGVQEYLLALPAQIYDPHSLTKDDAWLNTWPVTYYMWWIAWSPFVGVFIARISRGRTIRQFIAGVLMVPAVFSFLWFGVLGGAALYFDQQGELTALDGQLENFPAVTYALLGQLPFPELTSALAVLLLFFFLVTSADSGTYVLAMFTSHGDPEPPKADRLFWGGMMALVLGGLMLLGNGLAFMKAMLVVAAIPFLVVLAVFTLVLCVVLWRDVARMSSR